MLHFAVDGPIPALRLGFVGAPLCTVLSHNALAVMLIIYIVTRAIRDEVEYLREQNIVPDEPVASNSRTASPTVDNHSEVIHFFSGIGGLISAGLSGVAKSATQLWAKDFGGGEPMILRSLFVLLTMLQSLHACMVYMRACHDGKRC